MKHLWTVVWSVIGVAFMCGLVIGSIYAPEHRHNGSINVDKVHSCVAFSHTTQCRVETEVGRLNVRGHVAPGDIIHEYCYYDLWTELQDNDNCTYQKAYDGEIRK